MPESHRIHTASSCTKMSAEQLVPRVPDFPPTANRQVLVVLPIEGVASLCQGLYDRRFDTISLGWERHLNHVRFMGYGQPGAGRHSEDEESEVEFAKSAGHLALLAFNR